MNVYDSNRLYDSLDKIGYKKTLYQDDADFYILNTCHIRDKLNKKFTMKLAELKNYINKKETHSYYCRMCGSS